MINGINWDGKEPDTNFRIKEEYDYIGKAGNIEIAWEILRRSPEYRADFDRLRNMFRSDIDAADREARSMCCKYGLYEDFYPANPYLSFPAVFGTAPSPKGRFVLKIWHAPQYCPEKPDPTDPCMDVRIYFDQPFEEQIERYRKTYENVREKLYKDMMPRRRIEDYKTYCRILDAIRNGLSTTEIAEALYPNQADGTRTYDRVRAQIKAAKKMAASDYLKLAASGVGYSYAKHNK